MLGSTPLGTRALGVLPSSGTIVFQFVGAVVTTSSSITRQVEKIAVIAVTTASSRTKSIANTFAISCSSAAAQGKHVAKISVIVIQSATSILKNVSATTEILSGVVTSVIKLVHKGITTAPVSTATSSARQALKIIVIAPSIVVATIRRLDPRAIIARILTMLSTYRGVSSQGSYSGKVNLDVADGHSSLGGAE